MAAKKKGKLGGGAPAAAPKDADNLLYSAQQIWQAGLGALSRAQAGAPKVFEDLMKEGSKLQGGALDAAQKVVMQAFQGAQKTVNQRVDTVKAQAGETWDNLEKIFQTRVQRAMHQLGMPTAEEITALSRKVAELATAVERLAAAAPKPRRARRKG
jgi:poly(hydroxyalkanoate) granule-associated protein